MPSLAASVRRPAIAVAVMMMAFACWTAADWYIAEPPGALSEARYAGRASCVQCHQQEFDAWTGSHHDRAMEVATEDAVLGDFNDVVFTRLGERTRFFRDGKKFMVNAEGPDGQNHDYEIKWTFGVHPLQQYMVEFPDGRVQVLRVSWDARKNEWFYVPPPDAENERLRPDDPLHWTGLAQNWNTMCAECHSTDFHKNYNLAGNSYDSKFFEIDVSCEACHGPGSLHVDLANGLSPFWDRRAGYGLTNSLKGAGNAHQVSTCAPCHSRRAMIHPDYRAGDDLYDHFNPVLLHRGLYHDDGQVQDEVYEYGSFTQSKMYREGVRCTDCHNPHSLELKYPGNRLCAQCHQPGKYDGPGHHHHPAAAPGAEETQCVSCHMPSTVYMAVDDRRDHSIRVPRPDLTVSLGTPNACSGCHKKPEEDAAWAAAAIVKWYGEKRPDDPHYAGALYAAQRRQPDGGRLLRELLARREIPELVRATAVSLLPLYPTDASARLCRQSLSHESAAVRAAAVRAVTAESPEAVLLLARPLLKDSVRAVRISAALRLVDEAAGLADTGFRGALNEAIAEYRAAQEMHLDRADAHLSLATLNEQIKDVPAAIESFRTALRVEPYRAGPRRELARLLDMVATDPAYARLRERIQPSEDEIRRLRVEEVDLLARDARLLPGDPRPHYDRGLLLYLLGELDAGRYALEEACRIDPDNYQAWLALALICEKQQRWEDAARAVMRLKELQPAADDWKGLLLRMRDAVAAQQEAEAASAPHGESQSAEDREAPGASIELPASQTRPVRGGRQDAEP